MSHRRNDRVSIKDLDCENKTISINHATYLSSNGEWKEEFHISSPKTEAGIRTIPDDAGCRTVFKDEYEAQKETGFNVYGWWYEWVYLFAIKTELSINPKVINSAIKRIYEAYNAEEIIKAKRESSSVLIPHFRVNIRHTFCTRFCENERNLKVIQSIMGHANIETTMDIYAEATDVKKKEAIKALKNNSDIF